MLHPEVGVTICPLCTVPVRFSGIIWPLDDASPYDPSLFWFGGRTFCRDRSGRDCVGLSEARVTPVARMAAGNPSFCEKKSCTCSLLAVQGRDTSVRDASSSPRDAWFQKKIIRDGTFGDGGRIQRDMGLIYEATTLVFHPS
jgi:hypothetical protein